MIVNLAKKSWMAELSSGRPNLWVNASLARSVASTVDASNTRIGLPNVQDARDRFARFAPLLTELFPELRESGGVIESPLLAAPGLQQALDLPADSGTLWVKADHG